MTILLLTEIDFNTERELDKWIATVIIEVALTIFILQKWNSFQVEMWLVNWTNIFIKSYSYTKCKERP